MKAKLLLIILLFSACKSNHQDIKNKTAELDSLYNKTTQYKTYNYYDTILEPRSARIKPFKHHFEYYYDSSQGVRLLNVWYIDKEDSMKSVYNFYFLNKEIYKIKLYLIPMWHGSDTLKDSPDTAFYYFDDGKLIFEKDRYLHITHPEIDKHSFDSIAKRFNERIKVK